MSTIDERIVSMKFDNGQFMKMSADTLAALGKLKQGLDFKGAATAIKQLDVSSIGASVDQLRTKFEGMNAVVTGILLGIGATIAKVAGTKLGQNFMSGIKDGFGEYETQINAIQTIMSNTASKGTTMDQVNAALAELNTYSDKTIYNFGEMTRNIGTFTAAGVDLDTSTAAIKGIANLAAMSGSSSAQASTAMYQLSQALAAGRVSLMDWNSVVNAGMGGQVFQDALKETARAQGVAIDNIIAKNGSFRESLQEGWLTTGVLTETLAKFTGDLTREQIISMGYTEQQADEILALGKNASDAATKIKTFSQLMGSLSEAVGSGWAKSFQIVLGDFEEAKKLFTEISDVVGAIIQQSADARNAQLQIWKDGDERGSGRDAMVQALRNSFQALMKVIEPIRNAWAAVFPPTLGKTLLNISFALEKFTAGLIISDKSAGNLQKVFTGLFTVLRIALSVIGGVFRIIGNGIVIFFKFAGAIAGIIAPIVNFISRLIPVSDQVGKTGDAIGGLTDKVIEFQNWLTGPLLSALQNAGTWLDNFLNSGDAQVRLQQIISYIQDLVKAVQSAYNILFHGDYTGNPLFDEDSQITDTLFTIRETVLDVAKACESAFNILFKGDYTGNPLFEEDSKFADALFTIREGVMAAVDAVKQFFGAVNEAGKRSIGFWKGVGKALSGVWAAVKPIFDKIGQGFKSFIDGLDFNTVMAVLNSGFLVAIVLIIRNAIKKITSIFEGVGKLGGGLVDALEGVTGVLKAMQADLKANMILKIAGAIGILALSLVLLSTIDPARLQSTAIAMGIVAGAIIGILVVVEKLMSAANESSSWTDTLKDSFTGITDSVKNNLNASALMKSAIAILILAVALVVLASAVGIIAALPLDKMIQGMIGIGISLGLLVAAALILDKMKNSILSASFSMLIMGVAITVLAGAIALFGNIPIPVLVQGMIMITLVLAALVGAAILLSKFAPQMILSAVGLVAMAAALNMLVLPITALGLLPLPILAQGMMAVALMIGLLVAAATVLAPLGPPMAVAALGLMAMAASVGQLVLPITALGNMDLATLVQGILAVAAVLGVLVLAALAMQGAIAGAGAMILVAAALLILAVAIAILGSLPVEAVVVGLVAMAAALIIMGVAGYLLTGAIPGMLAAAVAIVLIAVAMIVMAVAVLVFVAAITLLGPAIISAVGGLLAFAAVSDTLMAAVPAMLAVGAGLIVLGLGAVVAGLGFAVLGAGLILLGAGLALVALFGVSGAVALAAVVVQITKLMEHIPGMLAMSGTFATLGAALLVMGAGLVLAGTGAIILAVGLMMLVPLGGLVTLALNLVMAAIERAAAKAPAIASLVSALQPLGPAIEKIGAAGASAAGGILAATASFGLMSIAALLVGTSVVVMAQLMGTSIPAAIQIITTAGVGFAAFVVSALASVQMLQSGLYAAVPGITAAALMLARSVTTTIIAAIRADSGAMVAAGYDTGMNMTAGMRNGIQAGAGGVAAAARQVARDAMNAARSELEVRSPSRKMHEVGDYYDQGLAGGIEDNVGDVTDAARNVARAAINTTADTLKRLKDTVDADMEITPTIKPVLDMSNFDRNKLRLQAPVTTPSLELTNSRTLATSAFQEIEGENGDDPSYGTGGGGDTYVLTVDQKNYSPKALSRTEIYRDTDSATARLKDELAKAKKGKGK